MASPAPHRLVPGATATLEERLLSKIVNAGPATPCAVWIGAYNQSRGRPGMPRRGKHPTRRPVLQIGGLGSAVMYVARLLLILAGVQRVHARQIEACHTCPSGTPWNGVYTCVDLGHLRWGTREENEADKYASS